ncbi:MAG: hypothetical protein GDA36_01175 [Rhodobacteraceae bacterium]|nr:hypothetical protein [Paracoccaceae bacterium]
MSSADRLTSFVHQALAAGHDRPSIERALLRAGWHKRSVELALGQWADTDLNTPVPRPNIQVSAKEAFLYAFLITTMLICAANVVSLSFHLIDIWWPKSEDSEFTGVINSLINGSIAALIVFVPSFAWVHTAIKNRLRQYPEAAMSTVRNWANHIAMFLAAMTLLYNLFWLIRTILESELSLPDLGKMVCLAAVSGAVLLYFRAGSGKVAKAA